MNELARYIFNWCPNLLTEEERTARKHLIGLQKIENGESEKIKEASRKFWLSTDSNVLRLLEKGDNNFYRSTVERVLKDNPKQDFLNFCPKCSALTRTPKAKQCAECFHSWHEE